MSTENQGGQTSTDALLAQITGNQNQPAKFKFGGQEWDDQASAEAAYAQYIGKQNAERDALQQRLDAIEKSKQQPSTTQYATGKESVAQFDQDAFLASFGKDGREGLRLALKAELLGDPNAPGDPIEMLKAAIIGSMQAQNRLAEITVRQSHPEINFDDDKQKVVISEYATKFGLPPNQNGIEAAIALAQRDGKLATRSQYDAYMEQQRQQMMAQTAQTVQQQAPPVNPYVVSSSSGPAANMPFTSTSAYSNVIPMQPQPSYNPAPPVFGPGRGAQAGINVHALLEKMNDPATPIDEVRKINKFIEDLAKSPTSAVG